MIQSIHHGLSRQSIHGDCIAGNWDASGVSRSSKLGTQQPVTGAFREDIDSKLLNSFWSGMTSGG